MYKCPKCKSIFEKKMDLYIHMTFDCNYTHLVAIEICEEQESKNTKSKETAQKIANEIGFDGTAFGRNMREHYKQGR